MTAFEAADQTNYGFGYDQGCYPVFDFDDLRDLPSGNLTVRY